MNEADLCVIGGGAAGLVTAAGAAQLGARVVLVEKGKMGGDCLHYGCVPSKSLLHAAQVAHSASNAGQFGVNTAAVSVDLAAVMTRVQEVIDGIAPNDSPERFRNLGVEVILDRGRFTSPHVLETASQRIHSRRFVIATGSRPFIPPIPGLDALPYLTNETVFNLREPVEHLLVMGGGAIGAELAQAFARLGSRVDLVEMAPQLLPVEDPELASVIAKKLTEDGVHLHIGHRVLQARQMEDGSVQLELECDTQRLHLEGSHLLIAAGRRPVLDGLGLEAASVKVDNGRLVLDKRLRTTQKHIYACGDAAGPYQFTHMAEHQAGVVLRNALFRLPAKAETRAVPWCTFTDPELARIGLSESQALANGIQHTTYQVPFTKVDRARTDGTTDGMIKLVVDKKARVLGAAIAGPHAGELIHEYVLAVKHRWKLSTISSAIHIYPTLAQINRFAADEHLKSSLTPAKRRWIQRIFRLRGERRDG